MSIRKSGTAVVRTRFPGIHKLMKQSKSHPAFIKEVRDEIIKQSRIKDRCQG